MHAVKRVQLQTEVFRVLTPCTIVHTDTDFLEE